MVDYLVDLMDNWTALSLVKLLADWMVEQSELRWVESLAVRMVSSLAAKLVLMWEILLVAK
jgi:hypothetical protein